ncbi:hypothetical protein CTRI78_v008499 [Colletotrichum trifolii]|uniref:Uncharacterized protein n=1 Tax=Colletotrichum trifolii TaxID=5466 RepID=A0A4R8QUP0_COLTR|nr:hypothetical protein CTRI78_v008499 [Colletotrichum trifolii]
MRRDCRASRRQPKQRTTRRRSGRESGQVAGMRAVFHRECPRSLGVECGMRRRAEMESQMPSLDA